MPCKFLTALPVYNEAAHVDAVLDQVLRYSADVLVVDDGSSDGTAELLVAAATFASRRTSVTGAMARPCEPRSIMRSIIATTCW